MTQTTHRTTVYIVKDDRGKLHVITYRPTDSYTGRYDSDHQNLMRRPYIKDVNHFLNVGDRVTMEQWAVVSHSWGAEVVAVQRYDWDYSKPTGFYNRASNVETSKQYNILLAKATGR
jgi:hypothetical protein